MNLKLVRTDAAHDGIFSLLKKEDGEVIAVCLEHPYESGAGDGSYTAKLKPGVYKCVRGQHKLHGMTDSFTTFEITGVIGHTNILLHFGNYAADSEGCVLLGRRIVPIPGETDRMITSSRNTFNKFMDLQRDVDQFTLIVE